MYNVYYTLCVLVMSTDMLIAVEEYNLSSFPGKLHMPIHTYVCIDTLYNSTQYMEQYVLAIHTYVCIYWCIVIPCTIVLQYMEHYVLALTGEETVLPFPWET